MSFTSGTSITDLNAAAGLLEYNLGGTGTQIGGQFNYSQRGPNVDIWISQHAYPDPWAKEIKGSYAVNGIRFADSTASWTRNRIGGELSSKVLSSTDRPSVTKSSPRFIESWTRIKPGQGQVRRMATMWGSLRN